MEETNNNQTTEQQSERNHFTWLLIVLAMIGIGAVGYMALDITHTPLQVTTTTETKPLPILPVRNNDPRITPRKSDSALTQAEFESEGAYYLGLSARQTPKAALEALRTNIETDTALLRSCHALTHSIGQEAYTRLQDFNMALEYLDEVCNTGYMHGVIEAKFSQSDNIEHEVLTVCTGHTEGRCLHGVGHGLMFYTDNDLPKSLKLCETQPKALGQLYCAEGVFMENFNTDQKTHPSQYLSDTDLFYPCNEQDSRYKNGCYYYAPLHYFGKNPPDYSKGLAWCNEAESNYILQCVRGVAAVAIKQNMSSPKIVENACLTALPNQIAHCIDGMTGLYINHYNSLEKAYAMCATLLPRNQKACTAGVKAREANFEGEVRGASSSL